MKSFWWFREGQIAGMARPGFNDIRWEGLTLEEAVLVGWFGAEPEGEVNLTTLGEHSILYGAKIRKFYAPESLPLEAIREKLSNPATLRPIARGLAERLDFLESVTVEDGRLRFALSARRIAREVEFLEGQGISCLVGLTERNLCVGALQEKFETHHLPIADVGAPSIDQARELAEIILRTRSAEGRLCVFCLGGLGRTSTLLIAAHLILGESLESLKAEIAQKNPVFILTGKQAEFVEDVRESLK